MYKELFGKQKDIKPIQDEAKKLTANKKAKQGMKTLRQSRTPDEVKQHLKYYIKTREMKTNLR